jgi:methyl-accepting chemotaxis protein
MKHWTIGKRIVAVSALLIGLMLALGTVALVSLSRIRHDANAISTDYVPGVILAGASKANSAENFINVLLAGAATTAQDRDEYRKTIKEVSAQHAQILADYEKTVTDAEDRRSFETLQAHRADYAKARETYLDLIMKDDRVRAATTMRGEVLPAYRRYSQASDALVDRNRKGADELATEIADNTRRTTKLLAVVAIGALLLGLIVAFVVIRGLNGALQAITGTLGSSSEQVSAAASQVSASSQTLASGASEQAASLEQIGASLEEISSMTKRNADNTTKANALTREARTSADRGSQDMLAMAQSMRDIKSSSDDIGKIIKTIDEIAFQTNILALNAAVEAARAGEAGAGFAVVADEVRALAQRSAQSAKETATKIETAIEKTAQGVTITESVQTSLREIVEKVRVVDELVAEVAQASTEQRQGVEQVALAVAQMDKITQSNAANAEESASASEELSAQAISLTEVVGDVLMLAGGQAQPASATRRHAPAPHQVPSPKGFRPRHSSRPASVEPRHTAAAEANGKAAADLMGADSFR